MTEPPLTDEAFGNGAERKDREHGGAQRAVPRRVERRVARPEGVGEPFPAEQLNAGEPNGD